MSNGTLKLKYVFLPSTNPIYASVEGANPNTVALQIMISNPHSFEVSLAGLTIKIPVGGAETDSNMLSTSQTLPSPVYDQASTPWSITSSGSVITITPSSGDSGQLTGAPILFSLEGIQVNQTPGTVPVTVTEMYSPSGSTMDSNTYSLVKQPSDERVSNFYATPSLLTDVGGVTLYWACTTQGSSYVYNVYSVNIDVLPQKDCLGAGDCYTCEEGAAGVATTTELDQTTTFTLEVIEASPEGERTGVASLTTTVQVDRPSVSSAAINQTTPAISGRVVALQWIAHYAASCTVESNGSPMVKSAPTDTYSQPYAVFVTGGPGAHNLDVVATGTTGIVRSTPCYAGSTTVAGHDPIALGNNPRGMAITPDGKLLLVGNTLDHTVTILSVPDRATLSTIPVGQGPIAIAVTPDGKLALVVNAYDNNVSLVDLSSRQPLPNRIPVGQEPWAIAVTPDGRFALVVNKESNNVTVIDIAGASPGSSQAEANPIPVGQSPTAIAIADLGNVGQFALVTNTNDNTVSVIDIGARQVHGFLPVGPGPCGIAVTPDGSLVLVANSDGNSVTVIGTRPHWQVEPATIPVGNSPYAIAVAGTQLGQFALVPNVESNDVTAIDIGRRQANPTTIPVGQMPFSIAVTPDVSCAFVANLKSNDLWVI